MLVYGALLGGIVLAVQRELGVPVSTLVVSDGIITVSGGNTTGPGSISYGDLIGGKKFNLTLTGKNTDTTTGIAKLKAVQEMKNVGKSPQRYDIPGKRMKGTRILQLGKSGRDLPLDGAALARECGDAGRRRRGGVRARRRGRLAGAVARALRPAMERSGNARLACRLCNRR